MKHKNSTKNLLLFLLPLLLFNCRRGEKSQDNLESPVSKNILSERTLLLIGKDTLRLKAVDTLACEIAKGFDHTGRFKTSDSIMLVADEHDTIYPKNFRSYYVDYFKDCYNDCNCYILDTNTRPLAYIAISKFLGETTPDKLIHNFETRIEIQSSSETYSICTLRFAAYCPDGKCQMRWSTAYPDSPLNGDLKKDILKYFSKNSYFLLRLIVIKDKRGKYIRVNPNLCWHYS